jgi:hypothetical protein
MEKTKHGVPDVFGGICCAIQHIHSCPKETLRQRQSLILLKMIKYEL